MRALKSFAVLGAVLFLGGLPTHGETIINGSRSILGNWDASGANTTKSCKTGTIAALPATCGVGECYFETNATAGQNLQLCTATNTWTAISATATLSGGINRVVQYDGDGTGVTDSIMVGTTVDVTFRGRLAMDSDGDATGVTCLTELEASDRFYADKDCDSTQDAGENFIDTGGIVTGLTADSGGTTTGAAVSIVGGIGVSTARSGDTVTVTHKRYAATVTAATSVTVTGATHGIGTPNLRVNCYDGSSPRKVVEPDSVTVDDSTFDVVITFFAAQTGKCYIE